MPRRPQIETVARTECRQPGQEPLLGPPSVAVHNDGDMARQIPPLGHPFYKITEIQGGQSFHVMQ